MSEQRKRVLIVDDESAIRESLGLLLKNHFDVSTAGDGQEALTLLADFAPHLVLLDVMMPRLDGIETLKRIKEHHANIPVVMLTAANTVRSAVEAIKLGAIDYLSKPFEIEQLTALIMETLSASGSPASILRSRRTLESAVADFGPMVGRSQHMQELFQRVKQVAERTTTALITGESGTGKELVARRIHDLSTRAAQPFIAVNCAAIPESLIESELFGHEKGAFTNAIEKRLGLFELADGGTLFLDEIGELSLPVQVKMLRFLQEQEFYRVGRSKPIQIDVRIVAATNRNLEELIKEKRFRQDLFYRINVISLHVPPLRDRFEDIPVLAEHFLARFAPLYGGRKMHFTADALKTLVEYDWPGNVRELENVIESIMALSSVEEIGCEVLPRKLRQRSQSLESFKTTIFEGSIGFEEAARTFETEIILKALRKTNYVQTRAAELLGISRRILKYKMDKLGIGERPTPEIKSAGTSAGAPEVTEPQENEIAQDSASEANEVVEARETADESLLE